MAILFLSVVLFVGRFQVAIDQPETSRKPVPQQLGDKWGYVDANGQLLIPAQFQAAAQFSNGLAAVKLKGQYGYIDASGTLVIPARYYWAAPFTADGLAAVETSKAFTPLGSGEYGVELFAKYTYIDKSGREIRPPFMAAYVGNFAEGLAAVKPGTNAGACVRGGYMNVHGQWAIKPQFDELREFSDGLAAVNMGSRCHAGGKWGYIDKEGKTVIPPEFDFAGQFSNGKACVEEAGQWSTMDRHGNRSPVERDRCYAR